MTPICLMHAVTLHSNSQNLQTYSRLIKCQSGRSSLSLTCCYDHSSYSRDVILFLISKKCVFFFLQRHLSQSQQACICWSEGIWVTRLPSNCPVEAQYNLIKDFWRKLETTFSVSLLWSHFCKRNTYTHTHTKYRSVEQRLVCSQFSNHIGTRCGFVCLSKSLLSKILHRSHCQSHRSSP